MSQRLMIQSALFDLHADVPEAQPLEEVRLTQAFAAALQTMLRRDPRPFVEARFYPYAGLSSTIRLRQGRVYARVSDVLKSAPADILYSLACILVAKLYRLKVPGEHERTYRKYTLHSSVVDASEATRRRRGFKKTTSPSGRFFDLNELFDSLNLAYFEGDLEKPLLSWGLKPTQRVLGHHDHVHGAIILSPSLDSRRVPRFVVEYVLYHEMLHVRHPARATSGRTVYHSPGFRVDERKFQRFADAVKWLEEHAPSKSRSRRRGTNSVKKR